MRRVLLVLVLVLVLGSLLSAVTQVRPGERAVVRRFGRVLDEQPRPGLWVGLPWGMDRVDRVPIHLLRSVEIGAPREPEEDATLTLAGQLLTGDHNLVTVRVILNYAVDEARVVDYVVHADQADELVARAGEAVLSEWAAGQTVDVVLVAGKAALPRVLLETLPARLAPYRLGVVVQTATVDLLSPPEEVRAAFDEVTSAQASIRTREHEARQTAARRLHEAQAERFRTEQQTAATTRELLLLAQADADRFEQRLRHYEQTGRSNPDYLAGIWWDAMSTLFAKMKADGRVDLLDNHLASDGLDVTIMPPLPGRK